MTDASQRLTAIPRPVTATTTGHESRDNAAATADQPIPNPPDRVASYAEASSGYGNVGEPPAKRRAQSARMLSRHDYLEPSRDLPHLSALRLQASFPIEPYRSAPQESHRHGSQEFRTSKSSTLGEEIRGQTSTAVFGVFQKGEYPMSDATQPVLRRGTSTGSVGISEGLQHTNEAMQFISDSDDLNDWENVVAMYLTGKGTPDGCPLRSIAKGDGHKVEDRKLLEKRRTIGKTYEKLGKECFERAIGYTYETGEKKKRKMYHVIARCRIVNAIRKANAEIPEDPAELDSLISHHLSLKTESRCEAAAKIEERA
jgi:hypothetical protein